jgi:hypothetical protein
MYTRRRLSFGLFTAVLMVTGFNWRTFRADSAGTLSIPPEVAHGLMDGAPGGYPEVQWSVQHDWRPFMLSASVASDLDGDGEPEVLYIQQNRLVRWDSTDGDVQRTEAMAEPYVYGIYDFEGTGAQQILVAATGVGGGLYLFDANDLTVLWRSQPMGLNFGTSQSETMVTDLTGDGLPDILFSGIQSGSGYRFVDFGGNLSDPSTAEYDDLHYTNVIPGVVGSFWDGLQLAIPQSRSFDLVELGGPPQFGTPYSCTAGEAFCFSSIEPYLAEVADYYPGGATVATDFDGDSFDELFSVSSLPNLNNTISALSPGQLVAGENDGILWSYRFDKGADVRSVASPWIWPNQPGPAGAKVLLAEQRGGVVQSHTSDDLFARIADGTGSFLDQAPGETQVLFLDSLSGLPLAVVEDAQLRGTMDADRDGVLEAVLYYPQGVISGVELVCGGGNRSDAWNSDVDTGCALETVWTVEGDLARFEPLQPTSDQYFGRGFSEDFKERHPFGRWSNYPKSRGSRPAIVDLDGDGHDELLVSQNNAKELVLYEMSPNLQGGVDADEVSTWGDGTHVQRLVSISTSDASPTILVESNYSDLVALDSGLANPISVPVDGVRGFTREWVSFRSERGPRLAKYGKIMAPETLALGSYDAEQIVEPIFFALDTDGDGIDELVTGKTGSTDAFYLSLWRDDGEKYVQTARFTGDALPQPYRFLYLRHVAGGDFNGDGTEDVVVYLDPPDGSAQAHSARLVFLDGHGATVDNTWDVLGDVPALEGNERFRGEVTPLVADLCDSAGACIAHAPDGQDEVVLPHANYGGFGIYRFDGLVMQGDWPGASVTEAMIADVDSDGTMELVKTAGRYISAGSLVQSDDSSMPVWKDGLLAASDMELLTALGPDVDDDGVRDLFYGGGFGQLEVRSGATGHPVESSLGFPMYLQSGSESDVPAARATRINTLLMFDIDGDGYQEVVVGHNDGRVYVVDLPTEPSLSKAGLSWSKYFGASVATLKVMDLDDDGVHELFVGPDDGRAYMLGAGSGFLATNEGSSGACVADDSFDLSGTSSGVDSVQVQIGSTWLEADTNIDGSWTVADIPVGMPAGGKQLAVRGTFGGQLVPNLSETLWVDYQPDEDEDGFLKCDPVEALRDCAEGDPNRHPDATEVCDFGIDNDCDGVTDDEDDSTAYDTVDDLWYPDFDGDEFAALDPNPADLMYACVQPTSYLRVDDATDCNDEERPDIFPGSPEVCDLDSHPDDENCDGEINEPGAIGSQLYYLDADGDGVASNVDAAHQRTVCSKPEDGHWVLAADVTELDCDDTLKTRFPGNDEICGDEVDNDCDGDIDESDAVDALVYFLDHDEDGWGDADLSVTSCETELAGYVTQDGDCDDQHEFTFVGAPERCDGRDNDCDDETDEEPPLSFASEWYLDADHDGVGGSATSVVACDDPTDETSWYSDIQTDCADDEPLRFTGNPEICNNLDSDCDDEVDEAGATGETAWYPDADDDGFGNRDATAELACASRQPADTVDVAGDCNDQVKTIHPDAVESCDGVDNNCDDVIDEAGAQGETLWYADADKDQYGDDHTDPVSSCAQPTGRIDHAGDCDDAKPDTFEGADELCDGRDNDCDTDIDEEPPLENAVAWYADIDHDGFGDTDIAMVTCADPTEGEDWFSAKNTDCDDDNASKFPGNTEICDGLDNDCDKSVDEAGAQGEVLWYTDADEDNFGDDESPQLACASQQPSGTVEVGGDCNDQVKAIHPEAVEICDGIDNDCDDETDEAGAEGETLWYADVDEDGYGDDHTDAVSACEVPTGRVAVAGDCDDAQEDTFAGALEQCDGRDNDCDELTDEPGAQGETLWYADEDQDGFGDDDQSTLACTAPDLTVAIDGDCNDGDEDVHPAAIEICDAKARDEDCNGLADDDDPQVTGTTDWFADADEDGFTHASAVESACLAPTGYFAASKSEDCDDDRTDVNPEAAEVCDGVDNDCNGTSDDVVETEPSATTWSKDVDDDGYGGKQSQVACERPAGAWVRASKGMDCDDKDAANFPDNVEVCDNADNDCDGEADETFDADNDGVTVCNNDCDDADDTINPNMAELCDGRDDDCDGTIDNGFDQDGDGVTTCGADGKAGHAADNDCDDAEDAAYPGALEYCDNIDNDCDGQVDNNALDATTWYADADQDGYADADHQFEACVAPDGTLAEPEDGLYDCDDTRDDTHPDADELPDGVDQDCDGDIDEGTDRVDDDGDGLSERQGDCDDTDAQVHPGADERPDGVDQDCDGQIDEGTEASDDDGDGVTEADGDCDDDDYLVSPNAEADVCEWGVSIDANCDGVVDEVCGDAAVSSQSNVGGCDSAGVTPSLFGLLASLAALLGRRRRTFAVSALLATGCTSADSVSLHVVPGELSVDQRIALSAVAVGGSVTFPMPISNIGNGSLTVRRLQTEPDACVTYEPVEDLVVGGEDLAVVPLTFTGEVAGIGVCKVTLVTQNDSGNGLDTPVELVTRTLEPAAQFSPATADLGWFEEEARQTVALYNQTDAPLTVAEMEGPESPWWYTDIVGETLAPEGLLVIDVGMDGGDTSADTLVVHFVEDLSVTLPLHANDCDGDILPVDEDGDGYTVCANDCDDTDPAVHPGRFDEVSDGIDSDCDGVD